MIDQDTQSSKPEEFIGLAKTIHDIVAKYTFFPTAIILSQVKRLRKSTNELTLEDLPKLADHIGTALTNFTNSVKGEEVKKAILNLTRN